MNGDRRPVVGLVGSSAGGIEDIRPRLVEPLLSLGYGVAVTLTPISKVVLAAGDQKDLSFEATESITAPEKKATRVELHQWSVEVASGPDKGRKVSRDPKDLKAIPERRVVGLSSGFARRSAFQTLLEIRRSIYPFSMAVPTRRM